MKKRPEKTDMTRRAYVDAFIHAYMESRGILLKGLLEQLK